jgi:hypothetical protein
VQFATPLTPAMMVATPAILRRTEKALFDHESEPLIVLRLLLMPVGGVPSVATRALPLRLPPDVDDMPNPDFNGNDKLSQREIDRLMQAHV